MSEALQRIAGARMRNVLAAMTSTTSKRIMSGVLVTGAVQSSSAVTVMIVSFVNAGLLSLTQSIGLIMGANIGTTFTAWLIAIFGFEWNLSMLSIPLIGFGFALILIKSKGYKSVGEIIIGFALLFHGLSILKETLWTIAENETLISLLKNYSDMGFGSVLLFFAIGTLITMIIQSSSATIALTLILCQHGWIPFECGMAMILGENLGTTVTANLAAIVANTNAKRAALSHFLFNMFGVVWMLPLVPVVAYAATYIIPVGNPSFTPVGLALFHTLFNTLNMFILVGFTPQIVRLTTRMLPRPTGESKQRLKLLNTGLLSTSELSIVQVNKEIEDHARRVLKMFGFVRILFRETNQEKFDKLYMRIEKYESITDNVEQEIVSYLTRLTQGDLGNQSSGHVQSMFKIISHIELIADSNLSIAKIIRNKKANNIWFNQELRDNVNGMFDLVEEALYLMTRSIAHHEPQLLESAYAIEKTINHQRTALKEEHFSNIDGQHYKYLAGVIYSDIITESEKLGDAVIHVSEESVNLGR